MSWYRSIEGEQAGYMCRRCEKFVPLEQFRPGLCECNPPPAPAPPRTPRDPNAAPPAPYKNMRPKRDKNWFKKEN